MQEFRAFVQQLAIETGRLIMPYFFGLPLEVEQKSDATPVTAADREAEAHLREMIRRRYPDHGIIGEEFGRDRPDAEFVWVLDPIDGTVSFMRHCPLFGTLIALLHGGRPILGAINLPALNMLCIGDASGTEINGRPARVAPTADLGLATVLASDISTIRRYQCWSCFESLLERCKLFRTWGDCYGYVLLAGGWVEIMLDPIMNVWDLMALVPIIQGAGGVITDWQGRDPVTGSSCVAAVRALHAQVLEWLNRKDCAHCGS